MQLSDLTKGLPQHQAASVMTAYEQGLAYVWGRQDAPGSTEARDTGRSERFAWSFAVAKRAFILEEHWSMDNLQAAYANWSRCRSATPELLTCGTLGNR